MQNENYEENRSQDVAWSFTVKKLGGQHSEVSIIDYTDVINKFKTLGFIKDIESEDDSNGRVHIHGIILLRKGFYRKRLTTPGFSIRLDEIYNEQGWVNYIYKGKMINNNEYMF